MAATPLVRASIRTKLLNLYVQRETQALLCFRCHEGYAVRWQVRSAWQVSVCLLASTTRIFYHNYCTSVGIPRASFNTRVTHGRRAQANRLTGDMLHEASTLQTRYASRYIRACIVFGVIVVLTSNEASSCSRSGHARVLAEKDKRTTGTGRVGWFLYCVDTCIASHPWQNCRANPLAPVSTGVLQFTPPL